MLAKETPRIWSSRNVVFSHLESIASPSQWKSSKNVTTMLYIHALFILFLSFRFSCLMPSLTRNLTYAKAILGAM